MRKMKKCLSVFLVLSMLAGLSSMSVLAKEQETEESNARIVDAQEIEGGISRLGEETATPSDMLAEPLYADDEIVTVIVEMEEAPVMDYYGTSTYAALDEDLTVGEAAAGFLASEDAKALEAELLAEQNGGVLSKISALLPAAGVYGLRSSAPEVEVVAQWAVIANAAAIKVPYGMLQEIRNIEGVKRAYVEHTYDYPEPVETSVVVDGKGNYSYSYDMVELWEAWNEKYTGKGMLIAVLDTGLDIKMNESAQIVRVHEAFSDSSFKSGDPMDEENGWELRYTSESLADFLEKNQLNSTTGAEGNKIVYDDNALYKNLKVPYACDYADGDLHVFPVSSHGTHVAGTIAGYAQTNEGEVTFSGIAPDAQILAMKVFPDEDTGATESSLVNALEDSLKLGADVINLSLGSDNGYAFDDTIQNGVYDRIEKAGIVLMTSAGNSAYSSTMSNYDGETLTSNPDTAMMSAPAIYDSNISVASIDNSIQVQAYMVWQDAEGTEHRVHFNDPWSVAMKAGFSDKEYPVYLVDGVGTYSDYAAVGFNNGYNNGVTGIALVKRGEISFADKVNNAMYFTGVNSRGERYGVQAVLVYDNDPNGTELISMSVSDTTLSSAFISGKDGAEIAEAINNGYQVSIRVSKEDETMDNPTAGQMSSFSSWGAGPGLELKPEITAPGGNIWSSIPDEANTGNNGYTGSYGMMSGTSMAAPHMSGIGLLVRQRVQQESAFQGLPNASIGDLVSQLLISTAVPQEDAAGAFYSPRQQGAGLVNVAAAIETPAYITVEGENVGKLELGDDPARTGSYDISFALHNISDSEQKYNVNVVLMRPDTASVESRWGTRQVTTDSDVVIKTVSMGQITVPAGSNVNFDQTVALTDAEKAELDRLFANGIYVEGYVILTDASGNGVPRLGLPLLAFYGDWTSAPIFDSASWIDTLAEGESYLDTESTWGTHMLGSMLINDYEMIGVFNLGQNIFDPYSTDYQLSYKPGNITISPNNDGYMDRVDDYVLYQLRDTRVIVVEVKDAESGEVYMRDWSSYIPRTLYNSSYGFAIPWSAYGLIPSWNGTDLEGNVLPSGTKCIFTITAYGDGEYDMIYSEELGRYVTDFDAVIPGVSEPTFNGHAMDMTGDVISFPIVVDTVAPKLENNAVTIYEEDGRTYLTATAYDEDGSLASVEVAPLVIRTYKAGYGDPAYAETGLDRQNPFYVEHIYDEGTKTHTFTVDITEYEHKTESYQGENYYYDFTWTNNVIISCGDYGANDRSYAIKVDAAEGIVLSQTSALLYPGESFDLSVNNNTMEEGSILTRTSSNPEVATVDEFGHVVAVAPGQTLITVSNGSSSAVCVVAVEEKPGKLESFELSLESFEGLKPGGQVVVNVKNIQPANAVLENISWSVSEDDEYAENYAAGLISVGKNTSDGLSGYLYLTVSSSEVLLPGGKAVLTVTIDGVSRTMEISWDDIYQSSSQDDLVSNTGFSRDQAIYVMQGETAELDAIYRQSSLHSVCDVLTKLTGITLDGPDFYYVGGSYDATLVAEEGYELPESVKLYTVYDYGYENEMMNYPGYQVYSYDPETGALHVYHCPYGATNKMLIVAEGVPVSGSVSDGDAGSVSGGDADFVSDGDAALADSGSETASEKTYERPDGLYGPFDWEVTQGSGTLELVEKTTYDGTIEVAQYTPAEPGVSLITAKSRDGKYSLNFAVISEAVRADALTLDTNGAVLKEGETLQLNGTLSPEPTLETDTGLIWKSYEPGVAEVSEDGLVTAVAEGYAYIRVCSAVDNTVWSYCRVQVIPADSYTVTFKDYDGTVLKEEVVKSGKSAQAPDEPVREGYTFTGWDQDFSNVTEDLTVTAQYEINTYTVTFVADGKVVGTVIKNYGETLSADDYPAVPEKEGYTGKWNVLTAPVTTDITVEAVYTKNTDPTPVDPTPVDPTPVDPAPVDPTPVDPTPVDPAPDTPDPQPGQPSDGSSDQKADSEGTGGNTTAETTGSSESNTTAAPKTGDSNHLWLWFVIIVAACIVVSGIVIHEKKRRKKN